MHAEISSLSPSTTLFLYRFSFFVLSCLVASLSFLPSHVLSLLFLCTHLFFFTFSSFHFVSSCLFSSHLISSCPNHRFLFLFCLIAALFLSHLICSLTLSHLSNLLFFKFRLFALLLVTSLILD